MGTLSIWSDVIKLFYSICVILTHLCCIFSCTQQHRITAQQPKNVNKSGLLKGPNHKINSWKQTGVV